MAKAEILPGACGFKAVVEAEMDGRICRLDIKSECDSIQRLASELNEVDPYNEIVFRGKLPRTLELGTKYCTHSACPVPSGIIKAIEIAAGLNLPVDVSIKLSK